MQSELRRQQDQNVYCNELMEYKNDLEKEFNVIRGRLEAFDPEYRRVNALLYRIVEQLKESGEHITKAFERFDTSKDGTLQKSEMILALRRLRIDNLSDHEINVLLDSIDLNKDGGIDYKEFCRKLQRCGLRLMSREDRLMVEIISSLKALQMSTADLFQIVNKDGSGTISR